MNRSIRDFAVLSFVDGNLALKVEGRENPVKLFVQEYETGKFLVSVPWCYREMLGYTVATAGKIRSKDEELPRSYSALRIVFQSFFKARTVEFRTATDPAFIRSAQARAGVDVADDDSPRVPVRAAK